MIKNEEVEYLAPNYPYYDKNEKVTVAETKYAIPKDRPVVIYTVGVFDLTHYGHFRLFKQIKELFPRVYLIVGVHSDAVTKKNKGRTVMHEQARYESVAQCRFVDKVVEDTPWILNDIEYFKKMDVDFIAREDVTNLAEGAPDIYSMVRSLGMFIPTKKVPGISTTIIITEIVKNYDYFIKRQILRGVSYEDINISFEKWQEIKSGILLTASNKY